LKRFLNEGEVNEDCPVVFQAMNQGRSNGGHVPFYIKLVINDLFLHNCMLHSGASMNVMTLKVMNRLGLKTTRPYKNVGAMDSREIKVCGLIKDVHVKLAA
jgi:hypothetical protein